MIDDSEDIHEYHHHMQNLKNSVMIFNLEGKTGPFHFGLVVNSTPRMQCRPSHYEAKNRTLRIFVEVERDRIFRRKKYARKSAGKGCLPEAFAAQRQ